MDWKGDILKVIKNHILSSPHEWQTSRIHQWEKSIHEPLQPGMGWVGLDFDFNIFQGLLDSFNLTHVHDSSTN